MPKTIARSLALVALVAAGCARRAVPSDPLVTDRPDFTESVPTVPRGWTQIEGGYTASRSGGVEAHTAGELLVRVGLTDRAELRVGVPSYTRLRDGDVRASGLEDASLGAKLALRGADGRRAWLPQASIIVSTSLPTGHRALRAPAAVPEAKLDLAWDLSEQATVASNLNAALPRGERGRYVELAASGSLGLSVGARAGTYGEWFAFFPREPRARAAHYVNGGATYQLSPHLQVDARAGRGVGRVSRGWFAGAGVARRF